MEIPANLQEKIKEEFNNIENTGMIRKIHLQTQWSNSMVVMEKPIGELRICLDLRDFNKGTL